MNIEKMLDLISIQRHDFLNHLQVISGLMQMNKEERAREYIRGVGQDIKRMSSIGRLKVPEVVATFMIGHNHAASFQINIDYNLQGNLDGCAVPGKKLGLVLESLINHAVDCMSPPEVAERYIHISIKPVDGGYQNQFRFEHPVNGHCPVCEHTVGLVNKELLPYGVRIEHNINGRQKLVNIFLPASNA